MTDHISKYVIGATGDSVIDDLLNRQDFRGDTLNNKLHDDICTNVRLRVIAS